MKCPYCNKDMISGTVKSSRGLTWQGSEDKTNKILDFIFVTGEPIVRAGLDGLNVEGYRCLECKKLIIDLKDEEC
ncbi:PF20097 family protein [Wukongibacter baidiensis]|uniref:PF20097 family protein n=1 Tax=Wukongibacter baidiensis TaxID=1723361 RepID=UPI003D7F9A95